jgi:hypothetical protein
LKTPPDYGIIIQVRTGCDPARVRNFYDRESRLPEGFMKIVNAIVFIGLASAFLFSAGAPLMACDYCLVIYPDAQCVYHYDPRIYFTVKPGDPLYNPAYDRGGKVLLKRSTNAIDPVLYQPPNLIGFYATTDGYDGYYVATSEFRLIIDGFSKEPTYYPNVVLIFDNVKPKYCVPEIHINGALLSGMTYAAGNLNVTTPTPDGKNYSDVISVLFSQRGCYGVRVWAFSDENGNGILDAGECRSAYSHDTMVPVQEKTWSSIKELFR